MNTLAQNKISYQSREIYAVILSCFSTFYCLDPNFIFQMAQIMQWLHTIWNYMKKVKSSISMVFGLIPNTYSLLVYIVQNGNGMHMLKIPPYKYPTAWSHFNLQKQAHAVGKGGWDHWYAQLHLLHKILKSMQSLHDLSHLEIIFQKAQSHISMVLFIAYKRYFGEVEPMQGLIIPYCQRQALIYQRTFHWLDNTESEL